MYVLDATPLIYLAKVDRLALLTQLDAECVVPERVYDEVVTAGLEREYADARRIEARVEDGALAVRTAERSRLFDRVRSSTALSDADAAVLAMASANGGIAVMDETYGRSVAETEGIEARGTAYLVLATAKQAELSTDDARATIDAMLDAGWYCAPDLYARIIRTIDALDSSEANGNRVD